MSRNSLQYRFLSTMSIPPHYRSLWYIQNVDITLWNFYCCSIFTNACKWISSSIIFCLFRYESILWSPRMRCHIKSVITSAKVRIALTKRLKIQIKFIMVEWKKYMYNDNNNNPNLGSFIMNFLCDRLKTQHIPSSVKIVLNLSMQSNSIPPYSQYDNIVSQSGET